MPLINLDEIPDEKLLNDPRLQLYVPSMQDSLLRDFPHTPAGLFIAESSKVAQRALDAGLRMHSIFLERRWLSKSSDLIQRALNMQPDLPVLVVSASQFRLVTGYQVTRGALCAMQRPVLPSANELLANAQRVAVLENINNYTNIGAIFRSAAALGIDAVLLSPTCHDPLFRRAARVSMGAVFQVPWTRIGTKGTWAEEGLALLKKLGFTTLALALDGDALALNDARLAHQDKLALVLGAEGDGLARQTIANCDYTVRIPMHHEVDSLNVAAASAVAFWELRLR